jgi:uncharacterized RDD family membrane protein YckC
MKEVGVGTRVINFIVDTFLVALISYGLFKWYQFYVYYYGFVPYQYYLFFYATLFIYYFLFELIFTRTPGKWLSLTKVRDVDGKRPAWYQLLFRSLLRLTIIDPFFIPFFDRTLHDQLSKTRVVEK